MRTGILKPNTKHGIKSIRKACIIDFYPGHSDWNFYGTCNEKFRLMLRSYFFSVADVFKKPPERKKKDGQKTHNVLPRHGPVAGKIRHSVCVCVCVIVRPGASLYTAQTRV